MCDICGEQGTQSQCPTCRERDGQGRAFPMDRNNWTIGGLFEVSWAAFKREWVMLTVCALLFLMGVMLGGAVSEVLKLVGEKMGGAASVVFILLGTVLSWVVQGVAIMGMMRVCLDVIQGQRADVGRLFSQVNKVGAYVVSNLLAVAIFLPIILLCFAVMVGAFVAVAGISVSDLSSVSDVKQLMEMTQASVLLVAVGLCVLIVAVPSIWIGMPLALVSVALADTENPKVIDTIRKCFGYVKGQRLSMFGAAFLATLILMVSVFLCCLPVIPAMGFFYLLFAGLYLSLSRGEQRES
ncbi:hypothetical protein [Myxococcus landrumensis]|uniref:Glycerophosphoryl diester phosphodiesterase membrane domain-containing protein n=1 Tax=Myxococcus landrumensis TaxID=2813577 RepID=A0ABX7MYW2_9BACT|nr:hypothetical protein [Myxococcus landrumus]QSQ11609.1 hypothetical protein JY572_24810 [Myxococcus landrumus]